jgi:hypothetical protein
MSGQDKAPWYLVLFAIGLLALLLLYFGVAVLNSGGR